MEHVRTFELVVLVLSRCGLAAPSCLEFRGNGSVSLLSLEVVHTQDTQEARQVIGSLATKFNTRAREALIPETLDMPPTRLQSREWRLGAGAAGGACGGGAF